MLASYATGERITTDAESMAKLDSGSGLGIADGRFAPCPNKPNCVSNQAAARDKRDYIDAFTYGKPASGA